MNRMDRRTRSPDCSERRQNSSSSGRRREFSHRRRSRSWSRSRSRDRTRDHRRRYSRSRSRERGPNNFHNRGGASPDLYKDMINDDYNSDRHYRSEQRSDRRHRDYDHHNRDRRDRYGKRDASNDSYDENSNDSFDSDQMNNSEHYRNQTPSSKIIILGLAQHITENDISNDVEQCGLQSVSIRLIRKRKTGASRGFAFVEFSTQEEATRWMEYKQGVLMVQDQFRAVMQYSVVRDSSSRDKITSDWYCAKCGVLNFKRRDNCFKCHASREESEKGGEGSDEVSNILTKKILLRNLDVLTNEEGVLTVMQTVVPELVEKISKILICRDPLTSTSRGICYLTFDNLVDSMNMHNALKAIEPALFIENRDVLVTYCVDAENKPINAPNPNADHRSSASRGSRPDGNNSTNPHAFGSTADRFSATNHSSNHKSVNNTHHYTLADVPRLAEYSAQVYASNAAEHDHYYKYYTDYYVNEINQGKFTSLPTMQQIGETANSGAAVALSAIQRKQKQQQQHKANHTSNSSGTTTSGASSSSLSHAQVVPNGRDNKKYATPDVSLYQYDEVSGYYYDPNTGLYYDAHSQYYYNNETCEYMYWNAEHSTYTLAPQSSSTGGASSNNAAIKPATMAARKTPNVADCSYEPAAADEARKDVTKVKTVAPTDKVKVAKKIVKDMEKWAKQLNQKKDMYNVPQMQTPVDEQPVVVSSGASQLSQHSSRYGSGSARSGGYADVGFSILENKERTLDHAATLAMVQPQQTTHFGGIAAISKTRHASAAHHPFESDSDTDQAPVGAGGSGAAEENASARLSERDYVAFDKLTCLLCKRAFPSGDVLQKHLRMSQLHKENLANLNRGVGGGRLARDVDAAAAAAAEAAAYRDRAKERRLKYGESDPPPVNKSRERWEKEMVKQNAAIQQTQTSKKVATQPIGENNVGNRLLQKMGWSEGQGLGRKNQGRTNIIEAESRAPTAGLGTKSTAFIPGDDYKTYIKRMMKSRYEQAEDN